MYLVFADVEGATGTIATDWTVEYDGPFTETTASVVSDTKGNGNGNAASDDLSALMLALYNEGHLAEIELISDTHRQDSPSRSEMNDRILTDGDGD